MTESDPTRTSNSVSCCRSEPGFCPTKALGWAGTMPSP